MYLPELGTEGYIVQWEKDPVLYRILYGIYKLASGVLWEGALARVWFSKNKIMLA